MGRAEAWGDGGRRGRAHLEDGDGLPRVRERGVVLPQLRARTFARVSRGRARLRVAEQRRWPRRAWWTAEEWGRSGRGRG